MECELWPKLYALVRSVAKTQKRGRGRYSDLVIVLVLLWAALHDRPICWACEMRHWKTTRLRPAVLPSDSTMSRRLESPSVIGLRKAIEQRARDFGEAPLIKILDGKPLPVGGCTKDPDAKRGRSAGGMGRGYKLHAIWSDRPFPDAYEIRPMNQNESNVAKTLIPRLAGTGYILADNQYDKNPLYELAGLHRHQLVAPPRKKRKGLGHHKHSPHRLHALELLNRPFGRELFQFRDTIERSFGNATSFGGGLAPLPSWVRRSHRVIRWTWAKLLINAVRIREHKRLAA
jgi:hypothetical protein